MMLDRLAEAFNRQVAGEQDRSGTGPLDILLQRVAVIAFDKAEAAFSIIEIVQGTDTTRSSAWPNIRLAIEKLSIRSMEVANAIEAKLEQDLTYLRVGDEYDGCQAYIKVGGNFTPQILAAHNRIKLEKPALWLELAIVAYVANPSVLEQTIVDLLKSDAPISWTDLKWKHRKLVYALGDNANWSLKRIAACMNAQERREYSAWLNDNAGVPTVNAPRAIRQRKKPGISVNVSRLRRTTFAIPKELRVA